MNEIVWGLMDSLKDHLQDKMVDNLPAAYSSYLEYEDQDGVTRTLAPSEVKVGRIQEDPTVLAAHINEPSSFIRIAPNDPTSTSFSWRHGVASDPNDLGLRLGYPRELGGGSLWQRRLFLQSAIYFLYSNQTEEEATEMANLMRGLLEKYCESYRSPDNLHGWQCGGLTDGFGETALESCIASVWTKQRGGPEKDYIWDIRMWIQVLTKRK